MARSNFENLAFFFFFFQFMILRFLNYFTSIPVDKICVKAVESQKSERKAHLNSIHGKIFIFSKKMNRPCSKHDQIAIDYCRLYRLNLYSIVFEEKRSPCMLNRLVLLTKYPVACHKSNASQSLAIKCKFSLTEK